MTLASGARLGSYEIRDKLGEGGMGEVWRASDPRLRRDVAIKVLPAAFVADAERLARFEREAQLLASLQHPNIAAVHGLEEQNGTRGLVMELVEGPTLAERLAAGALPVDDVVAIGAQIAAALEEAHERGIVHRDLKPANVKVTPDGRVKVLDFGLAKALDPAAGVAASAGGAALMNSPTLTSFGDHRTQLGMVLGTAAYMSPEQAKGKPVDRRADVWALGVALFEMLSGRQLFEGETASETLAAVIRQEIDWTRLPASTPPALRALLARCLERDPRLRLRDVGEARVVLERLQRGEAVSVVGTGAFAGLDTPALPAADRARARRDSRREGIAWTLAALLGVALAAGGFVAWRAGALRGDRATGARVIRAVLPLPPGVAIELDGTSSGMPVLSHDGRRVAFGAREGAAPTRIWVQDLATGSARPLAGTEGGYRPFWSPDDRQLGFFTWSDLAVVPVEGGAVRRLARARDARGGTWSPNGTIVYAPHQAGTLRAVAEGGGEPVEASFGMRGDGSSMGTHRYPSFLPDGEHFLYLDRAAAYGSGAKPVVKVGRLGSRDSSTVLPLATNAVFADGELLYTRDGALVAQPFDPAKLALRGAPTTLAGDLLTNPRFSYGNFSASGAGIVAFLTGRQNDRSQLVWRDRAGHALGTLGSPGVLSGYGGLAISPDGRRVAVSRIEESGTDADVWIYDLEHGTETRLARPGSDDVDPVFTADGGGLWFGALVPQGRSLLVRRDLASGVEREVPGVAGRIFTPMAVAPDGRSLLGVDSGLGGGDDRGDLVLAPVADGGERRAVAGTSADEPQGQISPDGRWVAWVSDESGRYEVYVAPLAGGSRTQVSRAGGTEPRWNPSGGELFFKTPDNVLTVVACSAEAGAFAVGAPVPLFPIVEFSGWTYDVAPDPRGTGAGGKRLLVREPLVERDASPVTLLTDWTSLLPRP